MRILVTGAAGFIGSHIVDSLLGAGHEVRGLDLRSAPALLPWAQDTDWIVGDVRDEPTVVTALDGIDAVCHQAAMVGLGVDLGDIADYVSHNDLGTAVVLKAMGDRPLVLASSMVVYGEGRYRCAEHGIVTAPPRTPEDLDAGRFEPPCPACGAPLAPESVPEDAAVDPRNVYAATKLQQELLARAWARESASRLVALRYHNVYGPRMPRDTPYAGVASLFADALVNGKAPQVYEDGGQTRDFVHVRDVARANVLALDGDAHGAFNVASGTPRTVLDLARALHASLGGPEPQVTGQWRAGDVRHVFASADHAREILGFAAREDFAAGVGELAHQTVS